LLAAGRIEPGRINQLEARKKELEQFLATATCPRRFSILRWRLSIENKWRPCTWCSEKLRKRIE